jgi:acetoin utilization deacetylase AcuC-like enzyme
VAFFSAHRWPFYPGTGAADETGTGDGLGATRNLPMKLGVSRDRYLAEFTRELGDFADHWRPQLVIVSAGFDAHRLDPVGSLGLESEDFESLTTAVQDVAVAHSQGRLVSVLEGGYSPPVLAECLALHLRSLRERE